MGMTPTPKMTDWIKDYHDNDTAPNHPGPDGASVSAPMGNCVRCSAPTHHEDLDSHRVRVHLGKVNGRKARS